MSLVVVSFPMGIPTLISAVSVERLSIVSLVLVTVVLFAVVLLFGVLLERILAVIIARLGTVTSVTLTAVLFVAALLVVKRCTACCQPVGLAPKMQGRERVPKGDYPVDDVTTMGTADIPVLPKAGLCVGRGKPRVIRDWVRVRARWCGLRGPCLASHVPL